MAIVSTGGLIDALKQHGLLSARTLAELPGLVQGRCGDARSLARVLVQRGWLTVHQINEILAGRGADLVFGPYLVLERLGQGGLSQVFKARHSTYDWTVALKVIKPEVLTSSEGRQQFLDEMDAMSRLNHPNIVQFCDADQVGNTCYFAMEYVEGTDLGKHVRLGGPLPVAEACDYIFQAALGLQHAYEHNLVHRDIKPVNLYLTHVALRTRSGKKRRRAQIKILDWGLAGLRYPRGFTGPQPLENISRGIVGTADYLSPEQARDAGSVDIRGDIYSLGCTFYFLLTGQPPFPDGTLMQKIVQHQKGEATPVDALRGDVPTGVTAILRRTMAKRPEDRFQTPAALALALRPFVNGGKAPDTAVVPVLRGKPATIRRDDTPLPTALGGPGFARKTHAGEAPGDTAVPEATRTAR